MNITVSNAQAPKVGGAEHQNAIVAAISRARELFNEGDIALANLVAASAYDMAKVATGHARKVRASAELLRKARLLQADALKIESECMMRLADEVDRAQAAGALAKRADGAVKGIRKKPTLAEVGVSRKKLFNARCLRDAEKRSPGILDTYITSRVDSALEPTRAGFKKVAEAVLKRQKKELFELRCLVHFNPRRDSQNSLRSKISSLETALRKLRGIADFAVVPDPNAPLSSTYSDEEIADMARQLP